MDLPEEVKKNYQYELPKGLLGFKPRGVSYVESGEPDRHEWFNLGQDSLFGLSPPQAAPDPILSRLSLYNSFLRHGQDIASVILRSLAVSLSLPPSTFTDQHPLSKSSGTVVRCIRVPAFTGSTTPSSSMRQHTDFGTITLLANMLGGLQILQPAHNGQQPQQQAGQTAAAAADDHDGWRYLRPHPCHLIVNLGDVMVEWTDGLLRSALHRVKHAPGQQSSVDRYSLGIFVRPRRDVSMKSLMRKAKTKIANGGIDNNNEKEEEEDKKAPTVHEWELQRTAAQRVPKS